MIRTLLLTTAAATTTLFGAYAQTYQETVEAGLQAEFNLPAGTIAVPLAEAAAIENMIVSTYGFNGNDDPEEIVDVDGVPTDQGITFATTAAGTPFSAAARFVAPDGAFAVGDRGLLVAWLSGQAADGGTSAVAEVHVEKNGAPFTKYGTIGAQPLSPDLKRYFVPFEVMDDVESAGIVFTAQYGTTLQSGTFAAPVFINYGTSVELDQLPTGQIDGTSSVFDFGAVLSDVRVGNNPTASHWNLRELPAGERFDLYDPAGRQVSTGEVPADGALRLEAAQLPAGFYSFRIGNAALRLVRQ